jgi:hypothetical protein
LEPEGAIILYLSQRSKRLHRALDTLRSFLHFCFIMVWDYKLLDSVSVSPLDCIYQFFCLPCAWGELYAVDQGERCLQPQCLIGTLIAIVPVLNCFCFANRRAEQMERMGMYVDYLEVCAVICGFPSACCFVHQERLQYNGTGAEPKLILME